MVIDLNHWLLLSFWYLCGHVRWPPLALSLSSPPLALSPSSPPLALSLSSGESPAVVALVLWWKCGATTSFTVLLVGHWCCFLLTLTFTAALTACLEQYKMRNTAFDLNSGFFDSKCSCDRLWKLQSDIVPLPFPPPIFTVKECILCVRSEFLLMVGFLLFSGTIGPRCEDVCSDYNPCQNWAECRHPSQGESTYTCECGSRQSGRYCQNMAPLECPAAWWGNPVCGPCSCDTNKGFDKNCDKKNGTCICKVSSFRFSSRALERD